MELGVEAANQVAIKMNTLFARVCTGFPFLSLSLFLSLSRARFLLQDGYCPPCRLSDTLCLLSALGSRNEKHLLTTFIAVAYIVVEKDIIMRSYRRTKIVPRHISAPQPHFMLIKSGFPSVVLTIISVPICRACNCSVATARSSPSSSSSSSSFP
jgi:hypothetical protein